MTQDWSIQDVAQLSGVSSRTLRHYHQIGLLEPSRIGYNGYRYYDSHTLIRLQTILLMREQGLGLNHIAQVLEGKTEHLTALQEQLEWLQAEQGRLDRQIQSVEHTIHTLKGGGNLMAEEMFDGFDHTQYRDEVEQRWGKRAYADSDRWWRGMSPAEKQQWKSQAETLGAEWLAAVAAGIPADSERAQQVAAQHVAWLKGIPGTPAADPNGDLKSYVLGLADMYVADERFAVNYGGVEGATFVRDALRHYMQND